MSWYTIDHACGHSRETQLYGKTSGREDKVAYMAGQDCPQCWGAKKREAESKMPIAMTVRTNGLDTDPVGNIMAEIILTGGTVPRKDEIKALGYHWAEVRGGVLSMLSMSAPDKAWIKTAPLAELADATSAANRAMTADAKALGITQIKNGIGPLDIAMAQKGRWFVFFQPLGFFLFTVGILAIIERQPVDIPEADYSQLATLDSMVDYLAKKCGSA